MRKLLFETLSGSRLYGTHRPDSDWDYRGVFLEPVHCILGLDEGEQHLTHTIIEHEVLRMDLRAAQMHDDVEYYSLRKFVRLAVDCNPNILDVFFAPIEAWTHVDSLWMPLLEIRNKFLTQRVRHTYAGYAFSQLHRIKNHRKWIHCPPQEPAAGVKRGVNDEWTKYQEWLANRNPDRLALEMRYGYDTKHAMHLFRLLFQAKDILTNKTFNPRLKGYDLEKVMRIKHGQIGYDEMLMLADHMIEEIRSMPSDLPDTPVVRKEAGVIVMKIYKEWILDS